MQTLLGQGVNTYAIGYSDDPDVDSAFLDMVAMEGGTGSSIDAVDGVALQSAFSNIAGEIASCSYQYTASMSIDNTVVLLNDEFVDQDPDNGYSLDIDGNLEFHGTTCEAIKAATDVNVQVVTNCEVIVQ